MKTFLFFVMTALFVFFAISSNPKDFEETAVECTVGSTNTDGVVHYYEDCTEYFSPSEGAPDVQVGNSSRNHTKDQMGRLHGLVTETRQFEGKEFFYQEGLYHHGVKVGKHTIKKGDITSYICYENGIQVKCDGLSNSETRSQSSYAYLVFNYPWFLDRYSDELPFKGQVESYLDMVDDQLGMMAFDPEDFDEYYEEALFILDEEELWDSVVSFLLVAGYIPQLDGFKSFEYRLAQMRRLKGFGGSSYEITSQFFPHIVQEFQDAGVNKNNLELFMNDYDLKLDQLKGGFPSDDSFFSDSVDTWMTEVLLGYFDEEFVSEISKLKKNKISRFGQILNSPREIFNLMNVRMRNDFSQEAEALVFLNIKYYQEADIVRNSVRRAWINRNGHTRLPLLSTWVLGSPSETEVNIRGYVIDDGNAEVTERGWVWDTIYHPTLGSNKLSLGSGLGEYTTTLSNIIPGKRYYYRSYAINTLGIGYGNVSEYVTSQVTSSDNAQISQGHLILFPVPSRDRIQIQLSAESDAPVVLEVFNVQGRLVLSRNYPARIPANESLDVSSWHPGVYILSIQQADQVYSTRFVVL